MGRSTDAGAILALVGCWAKDGVSETAVGRSRGRALSTGEEGGLDDMATAAADETRSKARRKRGEAPCTQYGAVGRRLGGDGGSLRR